MTMPRRMLVSMSDEARSAHSPSAPASGGLTSNGTGERVVPLFTPPEPPIPTRYYAGKGAALTSPPPAED